MSADTRRKSKSPLRFTSQANGSSSRQHGQQSQKPSSSILEPWVEPPLREPVPSFQDHPGLVRTGVLEHMLPLGTFPTARIKARAKGDSLRKTIQAKNLGTGGMMIDEGRDTPEAFEQQTRAGTVRADAYSQQPTPSLDPAIDPALMDFDSPPSTYTPATLGHSQTPLAAHMMQLHEQIIEHPTLAQQMAMDFDNAVSQHLQSSLMPQQQQAPAAQMQSYTMDSQRPAPPQNTTPAQVTTPTAASSTKSPLVPESGSPFFAAVTLANRNGTPEVKSTLAFLYTASQQDPDLSRLLQQASHMDNGGSLVTDRNSELAQKIKAVKKRFRSQSNSPATSMAPESSRQASLRGPVSPTMQQSQATMATNVMNNFSSLANFVGESPAPLLQSSSFADEYMPASESAHPPKRVKLASDSDILPNMSDEADPSSLQRRTSSSSLSSVNENVINKGDRPATAEELRQSTLKRSHEQVESLLNDKDSEMEAKRIRMRQDYSEVPVYESNVRKPNAVAVRATSTDTSTPKGTKKLKFWPPGMQTEIVEANGDLPTTPTALGRPPGSKKKKDAIPTPRFKIAPTKPTTRAAVAGMAPLRSSIRQQANRGVKRTREESEEAVDNNDYCDACGGSGLLLCCDGCDSAFHFTCLDPPFDRDAHPDTRWFCLMCVARQGKTKDLAHGLFASLLEVVDKTNPKSFQLPDYIQHHFKGTEVGIGGEYEEARELRPLIGGRIGYDDGPDYKRLRDNKGNVIQCYACCKTSGGTREIISCDYCTLNWHLDCLNPPLAKVPYRGANLLTRKRNAWMCPNHIEHDLKQIDPFRKGVIRDDLTLTRSHRMRIPAKPMAAQAPLKRVVTNNGIIEVESESENDSGFESEYDDDGTVYMLPRKGIKLDFINHVKETRFREERRAHEQAAALDLEAKRLQRNNEQRLANDIGKRQFLERKAAFNLTQFKANNADLNLGKNEIENLIMTLEAEAPPEVVAQIVMDEAMTTNNRKNNASASTSRSLPSPPASSSVSGGKAMDQRERELLLRMQAQIQQRLEAGVNEIEERLETL